MTFLRYLSIQALAYLLDFGTFSLILNISDVAPVWANVAAKCVAGCFAFFAHRRFTFCVDGRAYGRQAISYLAVLFLNIPIASLMLAGLLAFSDFPHLAKIIADVICVGLTYCLSKYFIFKDETAERAPQGEEVRQE